MLKPHYYIEFGKHSGKRGYAILKFPMSYSLTYRAMDFIYQHVKAANLYLEMVKDRLIFHMKNMRLRQVSKKLADFLKRQIRATPYLVQP